MWNCSTCGCQAIAGSVAWCPMCGEEQKMPKITVDGGPSDPDSNKNVEAGVRAAETRKANEQQQAEKQAKDSEGGDKDKPADAKNDGEYSGAE
jgi:hypothetical protein